MINQVLEQRVDFNNLSVKDLLEARDMFHVHLMNKANVEGTAIGRFRIRNSDFVNDRYIRRAPDYIQEEEKNLGNSRIADWSWPCILVFVSRWKTREELKSGGISEAIPPHIYMPDGRVVPICVIAAPKRDTTESEIDERKLDFPNNAIGGGYPLIIESQGIKKVASVGCVVTNGNKYFALTNKHVTGDPGASIFSKLKGKYEKVGTTTGINIGNSRFQAVYDGWIQQNLFVNVDVGLIEIDDINKWKTDIYNLGPLGEVVDINTQNITLKLIGFEVCAHGAVSGNLEGEIAALFYRYKSIGGYEYVADFLIGPRPGKLSLNTLHGDSGTLWTIPNTMENGEPEYLPIALQWGQRTIIGADKESSNSFALATNLSHVCRDLDVEIVRGWNMDLDYTWGKTGHFKVGYAACDIVTNTKLKKLLALNADSIGINDQDLIDGKVPSGIYTDDFVSLTDVADMYWRTKRPSDKSNHFADMDDQHEDVYENKSLLELCFDRRGHVKNDWLDVDKWLDFYEKLDDAKPDFDDSGRIRKRMGGLPFRVWQMYNEMVSILKGNDTVATKLAKFVVAGGTMSHYIGDACQPLHISYLHDGYPDGTGKGVHSAYETNMLDIYKKKSGENFLSGITDLLKDVRKSELVTGGKNAAKAVLSLMWETYHLIPPQDIVDVYIENRTAKALWENFGERTQQTIANGAHTMAVIWQSAWIEGNGDKFGAATKPIKKSDLMKWYKKPSFVQSYKLNDPALKALLV